MRRWFAVLLLLLLPLQFSWAAVAGYCQHEKDVTPQHMGHHEHAHQAPAPAAAAPDSADDAGSIAAGVHADCAYCHLSVAKTFSSASVVLPSSVPDAYVSLTATTVESQLFDRIERPNWRCA